MEPDATLQHRLTAILAADVAGYSAMMGADERATVAALDEVRAVFRREIEANGGRVVDMAGDSILALFETATGALTAALAAQKDLDASKAMRVRIGVHLGDVYVKPDGSAYGNGVNVAARLQAAAHPGAICVSQALYEVVRQKLVFQAQFGGPQKFKNIRDPVPVWHVADVHAELHIPEPAKAAKHDPRRRFLPFAVIAAVILGIAGAWLGIKHWATDRTHVAEAKSIAVIPFTNMSDDKDTAWFADGVHEDLLTQLALLGDLKVISRTSVMDYRDTKKKSPQIAAELGVVSLVEGSVRRSGNTVRVTAQLIDAKSDKHVWAKTYDRELKDVFALQSELATDIAKSLHVSLDQHDRARLAKKPTENLQAYELFLRQQESVHQNVGSVRMGATLEGRIGLLTKAVELDPNFALAWARLAGEHSRAYSWQIDRTPERLTKAKQAFERSQALAPDDPLVLIEAGNYYRHALGDLARSAQAYQRVLASAPNNVDALVFLAAVRSRQMQWGENAALLERALALDPRNPSTLDSLSWQYREFRQFDRAAVLMKQIMELRPNDQDLQSRFHWMEYWRTGSWASYDAWRATLAPDAAKDLAGVGYLDFTRAVARRDFDGAIRLLDVVSADVKAGFDSGERATREMVRALALRAKGDPGNALKAAKAAMQLVDAELQKSPDATGQLIKKARLHALLGERDAAFASHARAVALDRDAGNLTWAEQTQREAMPLHALLGDRREAMAELARQLKLPGAMPHELKVDLALASLWDDPHFKSLVADPANNAPISFDIRYGLMTTK